MKYIFSLLLVLAACTGASSQSVFERRTTIKKLYLTEPITSIIINDGVNVVLIDDVTNEVFAEGREEFTESLNFNYTNGELTISSTNKDESKPVAVFISARYLKHITINGNSIVGSYQTIQNNKLKVIINGNCKLMIRLTGTIDVSSSDEFQYSYYSRKLKN